MLYLQCSLFVWTRTSPSQAQEICDCSPDTPQQISYSSSILEKGVQQEVEIEFPPKPDESLETEQSSLTNEVEVQCELLGRYSIENFKNNPKVVLFYTGFNSYEHFMFLFYALGPAAFETQLQML